MPGRDEEQMHQGVRGRSSNVPGQGGKDDSDRANSPQNVRVTRGMLASEASRETGASHEGLSSRIALVASTSMLRCRKVLWSRRVLMRGWVGMRVLDGWVVGG